MKKVFSKEIYYEKVYFYLVCLLAFSIPLSRAGISLSISLLLLTWIVEGKYKEKFTLLKNISFLNIASFFFLYMIISLLWTDNLAEGLHFLRLYFYWLVIPVIITSLNSKYLPYIINTFIAAMFISELLTYGVYFDFWSIKGATPEHPTIFMTHITYSVLLAITFILLLNKIFSSSTSMKSKIFPLFFSFLVLGNLLISNGRTGLVALAVASFILIIMHFRHSIKTIFLLFITVIIMVATAYYSIDNFQNRVNATFKDLSTIEENHYASSIGIRLSFWLVSKDIFLEHPILGVGIGDSSSVATTHYEKNNYDFDAYVLSFTKDQHFHNIYLQTLVQTGLIGLFFILAIFYNLMRLKIKNREYKIFSIMFTIIFFIASFSEPLWYKQTTLALFILFSGLLLKMQNETRKD